MSLIKHLQFKVRSLTKLLDDQMGTPCEQIRHQQQVEDLMSVLKRIAKIEVPDDPHQARGILIDVNDLAGSVMEKYGE